MRIILDPHGAHGVAAAETDRFDPRQAWISRQGVVYVSTNSDEGESDWEGLTEFAREAAAALRAAVADQ